MLDLEAEVGSPSFERLPRGVRATAAGELLLAYVRRSLKELRLVEAQIDGLRGLVHGRVHIAVAESVTGRMLPDAIAEYHGRHPGVGFSVRVGGPKEIASALLRDKVELILTHEHSDDPEMVVLAETFQPLCVLVTPEHPLAARSQVRLSECVAYPIAMPDETLAARALDGPVSASPFDSIRAGAGLQFDRDHQDVRPSQQWSVLLVSDRQEAGCFGNDLDSAQRSRAATSEPSTGESSRSRVAGRRCVVCRAIDHRLRRSLSVALERLEYANDALDVLGAL